MWTLRFMRWLAAFVLYWVGMVFCMPITFCFGVITSVLDVQWLSKIVDDTCDAFIAAADWLLAEWRVLTASGG
jgi:hypothetical protein